MNEIYWITRMDTITAILIILLIVSAISTIVLVVCYFDPDNDGKGIKKLLKKWSIASVVSTFVLLLAVALTPDTKDMCMIYGIGGIIDYVQENDTAKQLPDKAIQALDKLMDEYLEEEKCNAR